MLWRIVIFGLLITYFMTGLSSQAGTVNLLTDIKAVCVYENPGQIDWGLVYHLAVENGCHVDLVTIKTGPSYQPVFIRADKYNLNSIQFYIPEATPIYFDTIKSDLFAGYIPDIVIFLSDFQNDPLNAFESYLLNLTFDSSAVFNIKKYYRKVEEGSRYSLFIKENQYFEYYGDEINRMADAVSEEIASTATIGIYTVYDLIKSRPVPESPSASFLAGIDRFKFDLIADKYVEGSVQKAALKMHKNKYIELLKKSLEQTGAERIGSLLGAIDAVKKFRQAYYYQIGAVDTLTPVAQYIERTLDKLSSAVFFETGVKSNGTVLIRETTEGKKLKFRSEIDNDGYISIRTGWVGFRPYWIDTVIVIDSAWTNVSPNASLIREYTVEVDPGYLMTVDEQSLKFVGKVVYGNQEMDFNYRAGSYEESYFSIEFVPDFMIIKPFPELQIDRLVEPTSLKAVLNKPVDFGGVVGIEVVSPKTVLSGAYNKELTLRAGERSREFNIPLVATKSMGRERHDIIINISSDGKIVASDIAQIRQAEFDVPTKTKIALLPDVSGILEDILILTGADYKSISERYLKAGNLDLYDIVIFGTGCFRNYESLDAAYDVIKKYMEFGGTVIVFGQTDDWRDDLLPVSIVSSTQKMEKRDVRVTDNSHPLFTRPYRLDVSRMLDGISGGTISYPAVVFPGEKLIEGEKGITHLSVSRFGDGKLIYCGLPLIQMVRNLDAEAIKLFSNLIHYSGK
nr:hypothetical protein [candidate division Zixibacteria bacterium]